MSPLYAGVDIGGTKCAVSIGKCVEGGIEILQKISFPTPAGPEPAIQRIVTGLTELLKEHDPGGKGLRSIGISCGGPLDSRNGLILSPPNLPGWDRIDIVKRMQDWFGVPAFLENDANACALAEWKWGAGQGVSNMVFLTFGTGMGAGLILNRQLYAGTNDMAGEIGHIRMETTGPAGYGKVGSFEGFCSGGGIAQLARTMAMAHLQSGQSTLLCRSLDDLLEITAKKVGEAAEQGDTLAAEVFLVVGQKLGRGLAMLVDLLNPERIVIGSIYARQRPILEPIVMKVLREEALPQSLARCQIVPAGLGEAVGDLAGLAVAQQVNP